MVKLQEEIKNIISQKRFDIVFQPIVSLSDGEVIGYEALTRGPQGSYHNPEVLFEEAEKACNPMKMILWV